MRVGSIKAVLSSNNTPRLEIYAPIIMPPLQDSENVSARPFRMETYVSIVGQNIPRDELNSIIDAVNRRMFCILSRIERGNMHVIKEIIIVTFNPSFDISLFDIIAKIIYPIWLMVATILMYVCDAPYLTMYNGINGVR